MEFVEGHQWLWDVVRVDPLSPLVEISIEIFLITEIIQVFFLAGSLFVVARHDEVGCCANKSKAS